MLQATHQARGVLVVTYGSRLPVVLAVGALAFLATALYDVTAGTRGTDRMAGLLVGAALLGGGALALSERSRFVFTPHVQTISWQRHWAFYRRRGEMRFRDIVQVVFQVAIGSKRVLSRRIVLRRSDGTDEPLTVGYSPDRDGEMRAVAEQIRAILGLPAVTDEAVGRGRP